MLDDVSWLALLKALADCLNYLFPHLRSKVASDLVNELLEANNQYLDDLSALGLADKQDEDVGIH